MVCGAGKNTWTPPRNSGGIPRVSTRFSVSIENEQANTRRDSQTCLVKTKFSGANGGKEKFPCSADHGQDWQPYAVDLYSAICDDHTCIRIYCSVYPQLPPVIGAPWVVAGTLRGFRFPIYYGSVGVQLTRLRALCQGILTTECVWKNLNAIVLRVTCTMQQSSRVFFYSRV